MSTEIQEGVRPIAVITIEPSDKISFVYNCMQTRLGEVTHCLCVKTAGNCNNSYSMSGDREEERGERTKA